MLSKFLKKYIKSTFYVEILCIQMTMLSRNYQNVTAYIFGDKTIMHIKENIQHSKKN